jgi:DNA topoisomerase-1
MKLLIVESPAKCQKIQGFLGSGWRVQATMGHIRALKEDLEAIGFRNDWEPTYENIASKAKAIASLRQAAKGAEVYLGSDDDREGESIAFHTCILLGLDPATTPRVVFHEITEKALRDAVAHPRRIDMSKFHAQQSRTMLDLLIGFTLSPCLWRGVGFMKGLSAGRCQTPALRIIYDRDREIEGHQAKHSWRITVASDHDILWKAMSEYPDESTAKTILDQLTGPNKNLLKITDRQERISTHNPPKPFITSSLQQEASNRCGMNPKVTMKAAQTLYEAGHITYMRTDNAILSQEAIDAASEVVKARWGEEYLGGVSSASDQEAPAKKKVVKKKSAEAKKPEAQAAHEGIRPTHMEVTTLEGVTAQEQRLYDLIWKRTIQSVMAAELRDVVKLQGQTNDLPLQTEWDQTRFAGWRILDTERKEEEETAAAALFEARKTLQKDQQIKWKSVTATEHRTSPPSRYTEASLIKELESRGIGRPSTYATLVDTVMERDYVEKTKIEAQTITLRALELKANAKEVKSLERKEKVGAEKDKLRTTPLGRTVIEWLLQTFGDMVDYGFTAAMEAQLDEVAKGDRSWKTILTDTWDRYKDRYDEVMATPAQKKSASSASAAGSDGVIRTAKSAEFGDGYKMVVSAKKGPLFVLEREGEKTKFATVPAHLSIQTATKEDAVRAFEVAAAPINTTGEALGDLDGDPVVRKKGKFGLYVTWRSHTVNCTAEDTVESLKPKLLEKVSGNTVDHQVGPYKIKRGPYGLYMFKPTVGAKTAPKFVGIPEETPLSTLTPESAEQLYKHCLETKKEKAKKK